MSGYFAKERPVQVVLYHPRPTEGWRYAIYTEPRAVIDGRLPEVSESASADEAQGVMVLKLGELFGAAYRARWCEERPGWWAGAVELAE